MSYDEGTDRQPTIVSDDLGSYRSSFADERIPDDLLELVRKLERDYDFIVLQLEDAQLEVEIHKSRYDRLVAMLRERGINVRQTSAARTAYIGNLRVIDPDQGGNGRGRPGE